MSTPAGSCSGFHSGRGHAKDIRVADRLRPESGPQRVADHAAQASVRTAVRIDGRRVVVGLDLEADVVFLIESDDPGVIAEDAHQPVAGQFPRGAEDRLLQEVVDRPALERDSPLQGLVRTMLAPGLGEGLELAVGGVPADRREVLLDRSHLGEAQRELSRLGSAPVCRLVEPSHWYFFPAEAVGLALAETIDRQVANDGLIDGIIGQQPIDQAGQGSAGPSIR